MPEVQTLETIELETLLKRVRELRQLGYRLVQIGATRLSDGLELTYSFDLKQSLQSLRLQLAIGARVPSIGKIYWCSFLYENEIHDLFGIQFDDMLVDFHGKLYQTAVKFPFLAGPRSPAKTETAPAVASHPENAATSRPEMESKVTATTPQ